MYTHPLTSESIIMYCGYVYPRNNIPAFTQYLLRLRWLVTRINWYTRKLSETVLVKWHYFFKVDYLPLKPSVTVALKELGGSDVRNTSLAIILSFSKLTSPSTIVSLAK